MLSGSSREKKALATTLYLRTDAVDLATVCQDVLGRDPGNLDAMTVVGQGHLDRFQDTDFIIDNQDAFGGHRLGQERTSVFGHGLRSISKSVLKFVAILQGEL